MSTSLFEQLKQSCAGEWQDYTQHAFVQQIADGSLPKECFKHYLLQDYLFLVQFSRAFGLAIYKSTDMDDIRFALECCDAIVNVELGLHIEYCKEWGISEEDLKDLPESTANMAYTRFVLEKGVSGDLLDLYTALAPCTMGYAEIATWISQKPENLSADNPYLSWIEMYSSEDYQGFADTFVERINRHQEGLSESRLKDLQKTFSAATRLEADFWKMGLELS
ncbi:thiaminase II [Leucothrix sargassi]|nr:thiaminase II [Leucothrix sargassi]